MLFADEEKDILYLLTRDDNGRWVALPDISIMQSKNKDNATFEMSTILTKFCILRTKEGLSDEHVARILTLLEVSLTKRITQIILRQRSDEPRLCVLQCLPINRSERFQRKLTDEGYELGPSPSPELVLREGQQMTITFRGNVKDDDEGEMRFMYNSHIRTKLDFTVTEIDRYAQKGIDCYRGFSQVYTRGMVERQVPIDPDKDTQSASGSKPKQLTKTVLIEEDILLCEMLINLPKVSLM